MIHHAKAVPEWRIAFARPLVFPAADRLDHLVVSGPVLARALRPIGADVAEDDVGIDRLHAVIIQPEPRGGRQAGVVVHDIGALDQALQHRARFGVLQLQGDGPLAALATEEGPFAAAHRIAIGCLHLDDVGAQIGQQHRPEGPGEIIAEIEHAQTGQGFVEQRGVAMRGAARARRPKREIGRGAQGYRRGDVQGRRRLQRGAERCRIHRHRIAIGQHLRVLIQRAHRQAGLMGDIVLGEFLQPGGARAGAHHGVYGALVGGIDQP